MSLNLSRFWRPIAPRSLLAPNTSSTGGPFQPCEVLTAEPGSKTTVRSKGTIMLRVTKIPEPITAFIKAINNHNTDEFLDVLTDGAVITDEGHDYRGIAAIKEWSDEKCIGANVTFDAISAVERDGENIVTAKVDGNF